MTDDLSTIARELSETRDYAIDPDAPFEPQAHRRALMQFRNAQLRAHVARVLIANMRASGMSDEQILQWAGDICPCASCKKKREERT